MCAYVSKTPTPVGSAVFVLIAHGQQTVFIKSPQAKHVITDMVATIIIILVVLILNFFIKNMKIHFRCREVCTVLCVSFICSALFFAISYFSFL